jgi:hypothetical protein
MSHDMYIWIGLIITIDHSFPTGLPFQSSVLQFILFQNNNPLGASEGVNEPWERSGGIRPLAIASYGLNGQQHPFTHAPCKPKTSSQGSS